MSKFVSKKPLIGITTGDPKGIGPEVVSAALADADVAVLGAFKIFGPHTPTLSLSDLQAAQMTIDSLNRATTAALRGEVSAIVTAPVNKARMRLVDKRFIGHTEFFAQKCGTAVCMMFSAAAGPNHGTLRVSLVTRHIPFRDIASKLGALDILQTIRLTHQGLKKLFGISKPRLAVAGLNPHAGEKEILGDEETKVIWPAIRQAKSEGLAVEGPFPPDTIFWRAAQGEWDAVVAMYHDQGLIAVKTLAFKEAVQVTLGLPFLRVSVDHGTAEDLVGTGRADPSNMKAAIRLACQLTT